MNLLNNIFYTKGKTDKRLIDRIRYDFLILDVICSPMVGKVQLLCQLSHPHKDEKYFFLEELVPYSEEFHKAMDRAFYPFECGLIKKVCPENFIGLEFSAELFHHHDNLCIDWDTVFPIESTMSDMFEQYDEDIYAYRNIY